MRFARSLAPVIVAFALAAGASAASPTSAAGHPSGSWTQFHYAATRSGYDPLETTLGNRNVGRLAVLWQKPLDDTELATPLVSGGRVFALAYSGKLYALRQSDGRRLWTVSVGSPLRSTPAIWHDLVVTPGTASSGGFVAAYDAASGARRWRTRLNADVGAFVTAPAVYGGSVYLSAGATIYALSASTGHLRWKTTVASDGSVVDGPVAVSGGGEYVVAAANDGRVYELDAATGARRWTVKTASGIHTGGPAIYSGIVYVPEGRESNEGTGFDIWALQVSDGRVLWHSYAGDDVHITPAAGAGMVVIGSIDEGLRALDSRTGALRWTGPYEGEVLGGPAIANGVVYVGSDSQLVARGAGTGALLYSTFDSLGYTFMSAPAIVDGRVYVGSGDGVIRVLGLR